MKPDEQGTTESSMQAGEPSELAPKPRWTRPEITSFKPVADAQAVSYRIGDGISNLS